MKRTHLTYWILTLSALLLNSCALERDFKPVIGDTFRVKKSLLKNREFYFLKSISDIKYPGPGVGATVGTGWYLHHDDIVRFRILGDTLEIYSTEPKFDRQNGIEVNGIAASFRVEHVDVLPKQNEDDEDTHEEEVTKERRPPEQREYVILDLSDDRADKFHPDKILSTTPLRIDISPDGHAIQFYVRKILEDRTELTVTYSFLAVAPSQYVPKPYPLRLERRFGVFHSDVFGYDAYGRIVKEQQKKWMNRWDASQGPILYYFAKDFPERFKPFAYEAFEQWNRSFMKTLGHPLIVLRENSGQEPGDLRYNLVYLDQNPGASRLLGYGPAFADPRNGRYIKADVFLYLGSILSTVLSDRIWDDNIPERVTSAIPPTGTVPVVPFRISDSLGLTQWETHSRLSPLFSFEGTRMSETLLRLFSQPTQVLAQLKEQLGPQQQYTTFLDAGMASMILQSLDRRQLTDSQIEESIVRALLGHETGHTLGLAHNFKATADAKHFALGRKSSSLMDYPLLERYSPVGPGPYDEAALEILYGNSPQKTEAAIRENYYYCTDESLYSAMDPLCARWDAATNLSGMAIQLLQRYQTSYIFRNTRDDRVFFSTTQDEYVKSLQPFLVPLRLLYDHCTAVISRVESIISTMNPETQKAYASELFELLRERIIVNPQTPPEETLEISGIAGEPVTLDMDKVNTIYQEAQLTRTLLLGGFASILYGKLPIPGSSVPKPDLDMRDSDTNEVISRGVLWDKMLALTLLAIPQADPISGALIQGPFETLSEQTSDLFASILSNVVRERTGARFQPFQPVLRNHAFELVTKILSRDAGINNQAYELFQLFEVADNDSHSLQLEQLSSLRRKKIELVIALNTGNPTEEQKTELTANLVDTLTKIAAIEVDATSISPVQMLKGPVKLTNAKGTLHLAAGRLIRYSLNEFEDQQKFIPALIEDLENKISNAENEDEKTALQTRLNMVRRTHELIPSFLSSERRLLLKFYRSYHLE